MERRKMVLVGAGVGLTALSAAQRARRAAQLQSAVEGVAATIEPSRAVVAAPDLDGDDEAHAAGHRHLPTPPSATPTAPERRALRRAGRDRHGARLSDQG